MEQVSCLELLSPIAFPNFFLGNAQEPMEHEVRVGIFSSDDAVVRAAVDAFRCDKDRAGRVEFLDVAGHRAQEAMSIEVLIIKLPDNAAPRINTQSLRGG